MRQAEHRGGNCSHSRQAGRSVQRLVRPHRALAADFRALAQQQHVGIPLDDLPSRTCEETLKERDYVMVRNGSSTLAVYQVRPDGLHRLERWPKELDCVHRTASPSPAVPSVRRGHASRVPFMGSSPSMGPTRSRQLSPSRRSVSAEVYQGKGVFQRRSLGTFWSVHIREYS